MSAVMMAGEDEGPDEPAGPSFVIRRQAGSSGPFEIEGEYVLLPGHVVDELRPIAARLSLGGDVVTISEEGPDGALTEIERYIGGEDVTPIPPDAIAALKRLLSAVPLDPIQSTLRRAEALRKLAPSMVGAGREDLCVLVADDVRMLVGEVERLGAEHRAAAVELGDRVDGERLRDLIARRTDGAGQVDYLGLADDVLALVRRGGS